MPNTTPIGGSGFPTPPRSNETTPLPGQTGGENAPKQALSYTHDVFEIVKNYKAPAPGEGNNIKFFYPVNASIKNDPGNRSAENYSEAIDQFKVATNDRYDPEVQKLGKTYCNTFVWDVTRAMGAEIPHWQDKAGNAVDIPVGADTNEFIKKGNQQNNANAMIDWLETHGAKNGWAKITIDEKDAKAAKKAVEEAAQKAANEGKPIVAVWKNPDGPGHIGMVRPGEADKNLGPALAQAGKRNFGDEYVARGFGKNPVTYWVHNPQPVAQE